MIGAIVLCILGAASIGLVFFMKNYIDLSSNPSFVWFHIGFIALGVVLIVWGIDRIEKEYGFLNALLDKRDRHRAEITKEERERIDKETGGLLTKAAKGDASAQNSLALCFYRGDGVKADCQKAVYWFTKAAEQGEALAQYNLGVCYEHGHGVTKNMDTAIQLYKKAASGGSDEAKQALKSLQV